jgi:predicted PurR-regulated permease PerM
VEPFQQEIGTKLAEWAGEAASFLVSSISTATQGAATFVLKLFVMLYAMFFFLRSNRKMARRLVGYLPLDAKDSEQILARGLAATRATLKSVIVIGAVQGFLLGIALWMAGIKGAAFWGSVVVVLSAIPAIGTPVIWIPASIYLILEERILAGVLLAVWGTFVVSTVDNILRPRLVGREVKLPDLLILISTFGGIAAFGPIGIILGPVIAAVAVITMDIYRRAFLDPTPPS